MRFTILCTFRPGGLAEAKHYRLEHYTFLMHEQANILEGGPLLGEDGLPQAMLIVVDKPDHTAVEQFIAQEPYTAGGFFESVVIRPWAQVIPEPQPEYIRHEHDKEMALRQNDLPPE